MLAEQNTPQAEANYLNNLHRKAFAAGDPDAIEAEFLHAANGSHEYASENESVETRIFVMAKLYNTMNNSSDPRYQAIARRIEGFLQHHGTSGEELENTARYLLQDPNYASYRRFFPTNRSKSQTRNQYQARTATTQTRQSHTAQSNAPKPTTAAQEQYDKAVNSANKAQGEEEDMSNPENWDAPEKNTAQQQAETEPKAGENEQQLAEGDKKQEKSGAEVKSEEAQAGNQEDANAQEWKPLDPNKECPLTLKELDEFNDPNEIAVDKHGNFFDKETLQESLGRKLENPATTEPVASYEQSFRSATEEEFAQGKDNSVPNIDEKEAEEQAKNQSQPSASNDQTAQNPSSDVNQSSNAGNQDQQQQTAQNNAQSSAQGNSSSPQPQSATDTDAKDQTNNTSSQPQSSTTTNSSDPQASSTASSSPRPQPQQAANIDEKDQTSNTSSQQQQATTNDRQAPSSNSPSPKPTASSSDKPEDKGQDSSTNDTSTTATNASATDPNSTTDVGQSSKMVNRPSWQTDQQQPSSSQTASNSASSSSSAPTLSPSMGSSAS